jgi:hypothetical protein
MLIVKKSAVGSIEHALQKYQRRAKLHLEKYFSVLQISDK